MLQLSVTALFYLEDSRKIHLRGVRACRSKDTRRAPQRMGERERERELALALLFICVSLPGPVLCKLGQPRVLLVLPGVLTPVLGPFVSFSQAFPFLVLEPPPSWTPFPCSTYLTQWRPSATKNNNNNKLKVFLKSIIKLLFWKFYKILWSSNHKEVFYQCLCF